MNIFDSHKIWQQKQKAKQKPATLYTFKESELVKLINEQIISDRKKTVNRLYAVFALTLNKMHGFGEKRLKETLQETSDYFDKILKGEESEENIMQKVEKFDIIIK